MRTSVRNATFGDMETIISIYENARNRMRDSGNPNQWVDGYPTPDIIAGDIDQGNSYVIEKCGEIIGVFSFIIGKDPTYNFIDGAWLNDNAYGTIHRIAASPRAKGIADICLDFCKSKNVDIRIDTHADNAPMLSWITSRGFSYCGIIYCHNGTPRKAFQLPL